MPEVNPNVLEDIDEMAAETVATALPPPVFLGSRTTSKARASWFGAAHASIAEAGRLVCQLPCDQATYSMTMLAAAAEALEPLPPGGPSPDSLNEKSSSIFIWGSGMQARPGTAWDVRREVVFGWLQDVSPTDIEALAVAWQVLRDVAQPGSRCSITSRPGTKGWHATYSKRLATRQITSSNRYMKPIAFISKESPL